MSIHMNLTDTHCHLYVDDFKEDIHDVMHRARFAGVNRIFLPNIDRTSIESMFALEAAFPDHCFAMMGLHPCSVKSGYREELLLMENWLEQRAFAGIGETGLDFYWDTTFKAEQYDAFNRQLEWAAHYKLPIVIHSRNSLDECIEVVSEHQRGGLKGIFHCFSGSVEQAGRIRDLGFFLGIGGVVTFKKGGLEPVIKVHGISGVVLETDSPYLAPVPFRGKRNEPSYLSYVVKKLADITGLTEDHIAEITSENAENIFGS